MYVKFFWWWHHYCNVICS